MESENLDFLSCLLRGSDRIAFISKKFSFYHLFFPLTFLFSFWSFQFCGETSTVKIRTNWKKNNSQARTFMRATETTSCKYNASANCVYAFLMKAKKLPEVEKILLFSSNFKSHSTIQPLAECHIFHHLTLVQIARNNSYTGKCQKQ